VEISALYSVYVPHPCKYSSIDLTFKKELVKERERPRLLRQVINGTVDHKQRKRHFLAAPIALVHLRIFINIILTQSLRAESRSGRRVSTM